MSYSGSGSVATLWSPSSYTSAKMPVPSPARRYANTSSSGGSYRSVGYSSSSNSYSSSSRTSEYRSRYTAPIRSSTSVPCTYSRAESETSRILSRDRLSESKDGCDSNLLGYSSRSSTKTADVTATLDRFKLRSDPIPNRYLTTTSIDSKYSSGRKYGTSSNLDTLSKYNGVSSKPPASKRKDSLTKSDTADTSPSPVRSLERKTSGSSALGGGGSSSPIEIRKPSEVWDKKLCVSYGEGGPLENGLAFSHQNAKLASRETSADLSDSMLEESDDQPTMSFAEIRRKFDKTEDPASALMGGNSEASHEGGKPSISNGVILSVQNFGQVQYLDRVKAKKTDADEIDQSESVPPQTIHGVVLKPLAGAARVPSSPALRHSPEPLARHSPELKKAVATLLPDLKEVVHAKLPAIAVVENRDEDEKWESRVSAVSSKLGVDASRVAAKQRGEKTLARLEQTLAKQQSAELEVDGPRIRKRSEDARAKKDADNFTKIIELKRSDPAAEMQRSEKKGECPPPHKAAKEPTELNGLSGSPDGQAARAKRNRSPKDEKESNNAREKERGKTETGEVPKQNLICERTPQGGSNRSSPVGGATSQPLTPPSSNDPPFLVDSSGSGSSPRLSIGRGRSAGGGEKGGLNGLRNIGNTCFMNSVIQCLSNTKPLLEYLVSEDYLTDINVTISSMKGSLIKAFSNVIQELWAPNSEDKIVNTTNFKSQVQRFAPRFMGYSQQDAQEFLRYLLEGLHEDVNRVSVKPKPITSDIDDSLSDNQKAGEAWKRYLRLDDSRVVDIFVGQLKSTLQCTVCGHCSVTFDPFWDLSLPMPSRTGQLRLQTCLEAFTKEEVLDGDEKPTCSKCQTRRKCTKSFSIQKFPKILVLHLKRFSPTERFRGKLSVVVDFPLSGLDLSSCAATRGQGCSYNLYAISNHSGTTYSGHYTAYCKHPYTGNWHEYNDSRVSNLSSRSVVSGEAYVLFYELASQSSHL